MAEQAALQAVHSGFESRRPFQFPAGVAKWSKATVCKAVIVGSNPITCSNFRANADGDYMDRALGPQPRGRWFDSNHPQGCSSVKCRLTSCRPLFMWIVA